MRGIILVGFGIMFVSSAVFGRAPDNAEFSERMSIMPPPPPDRYKMVPTVDPKSGEVSMQPMISEAAKNQSGGALKQDPEKLKREKDERIAEAKRRRREKKRLQKLEEQEEYERSLMQSRSISSEEFFESKDEMAEQYKQLIKQEPESKPKKEQKPIVVIEHTKDGPVKHIFYGEVEVQEVDERTPQEIHKEKAEAREKLKEKKQRLRDLQYEKIKNPNIIVFEDEDPKLRKQSEFMQQKITAREVKINPEVMGKEFKITA